MTSEFTAVVGPVIIENGKVLLVKSAKTDWQFPGGKKEDSDIDLEATCKREAKEELGIELNIKELFKELKIKNKDKKFILIHYLAERIGEINPGHEVIDWGWYDINKLPPDCTPNVYEIIKEYQKREAEKTEGFFNKK